MPQDNHHTRTIKISNAELMPGIVSLLNDGHTVTLPLHGNSMRPFLKDGRDKAVLKAVCPTEKLHNGDVVLAEIKTGVYVLHRIISIEQNRVILLGDGNITPEHCQKDNIKAIATGFYRKRHTTPDYTSGHKWKIYSWIWTRIVPLRRILLKIIR